MKKMNYITIVMGIIVTGLGLWLIKTIAEPQGIMLTLPYICIGIGCGAFGHGMGTIISYQTAKRNPEIQKKIEIEQKDERNVTITNCAKAKAYDIMTFVFSALMLSFALMGVDMVAVLLLVCAYLFVEGCGVYYRYKYEKQM